MQLKTADQLLSVALPTLLYTKISHELIGSPITLDLTRTNQDDHWPETRLKFFKRLNENRETLREQKKAVIIVLPAHERKSFRELSPDLWVIRDLTEETGDWITNIDNVTASVRDKDTKATPVSLFNETDRQLVDE